MSRAKTPRRQGKKFLLSLRGKESKMPSARRSEKKLSGFASMREEV